MKLPKLGVLLILVGMCCIMHTPLKAPLVVVQTWPFLMASNLILRMNVTCVCSKWDAIRSLKCSHNRIKIKGAAGVVLWTHFWDKNMKLSGCFASCSRQEVCHQTLSCREARPLLRTVMSLVLLCWLWHYYITHFICLTPERRLSSCSFYQKIHHKIISAWEQRE